MARILTLLERPEPSHEGTPRVNAKKAVDGFEDCLAPLAGVYPFDRAAAAQSATRSLVPGRPSV